MTCNVIELTQLSDTDRRLFERACAAIATAYAPHSGFRVGAAVLTAAGRVYSGCNVENASYGLTVCAERSAIFAAVHAEGPSLKLAAVACATESPSGFPPCGACRQVIAEFAAPDAVVLYQGNTGSLVRTTIRTLLPEAFVLPPAPLPAVLA
jgi:cytidine deaminase